MNDFKNCQSEQGFQIRGMEESDWPEVRQIFLDGIATGHATFQTNAPESWQEWEIRYLKECRLVAVNEGQMLGWAMLSAVSIKPAYLGVAEVSIYINKQVRNSGVGYALLSALIATSEQNGYWTLQAAVFPENGASLALHKKCGFREVGIREKIANHFGVWRNMLLLERRSNFF